MIEPSYPVIHFESDVQKLAMLKKWGLVSAEAKAIKQLYYKGLYSSEYTPCDVVGYSDSVFIIISMLGQLHSIHPDYLVEMQPPEIERKALNRDLATSKNARRQKGRSIICFPSDYVIIDTETTGLCPGVDSIIEFAGIRVRNNVIKDRFSTLINPGFPVSDFIASLTGITNEMLSTAPTIDRIVPKIREFISDDLLVGHNVNFDVNFLYDEFIKNSPYILKNDYVDTLRIARKALPDLEHHRLSDVAAALLIPQPTAHRAMADCDTTLSCLIALKQVVLNQMSEPEFALMFQAKPSFLPYGGYDLRPISARNVPCDPFHPLYGKKCVFTGELESFTRMEAAQLVADCGGILQNAVTKKTDYLILGSNEYNPLVKNGISTKQRKAESYILAGCDIKIIPEVVFLDLLSGNE